MISENEITKGKQIPDELKENLRILLERVNKIRSLWGKPMTVTSGFRSHDDHIRIYRQKGIPDDKIPWGSQHLKCAAVDIYDPKQELQTWCLNNVDKLADIGLWCEDFSATPNWCHFQILSPKSGLRFFMP
jgi:uncharacterized protein YcbK (DUF882 family)